MSTEPALLLKAPVQQTLHYDFCATAHGGIMNKSEREFYEKYTANCMNGSKASCACACPFNLEVGLFIGKMRIHSYSGAYRLYQENVVFPEIVSRICRRHARNIAFSAATRSGFLSLKKPALPMSGIKSPAFTTCRPIDQCCHCRSRAQRPCLCPQAVYEELSGNRV
jgi:hypothetical protein